MTIVNDAKLEALASFIVNNEVNGNCACCSILDQMPEEMQKEVSAPCKSSNYEDGHVGVGNGKAAEVPDAIKKAIQEAKKNLVEVPIVETTVPHEFVGKFGSAKVLLKPAELGTGLITGGSVRPVLELAGYQNVRTKVIGTNNPRNVVYATLEGLKSMQTAEQVAKKRGKKVEEIL